MLTPSTKRNIRLFVVAVPLGCIRGYAGCIAVQVKIGNLGKIVLKYRHLTKLAIIKENKRIALPQHDVAAEWLAKNDPKLAESRREYARRVGRMKARAKRAKA